MSLVDAPDHDPGAAAPAYPQRSRSERESAPSSLVMRNISIAGHRTSIRLEPVFWEALSSIARRQDMTIHELVTNIDRSRTVSSLSSAIRTFVVIYFSAGAREAQVLCGDVLGNQA